VPVVGLKNNQIVYINTTSDESSATHLKDEWTLFSALPDGVTPQEGDQVHFFPFNGHFVLSVGRAVWLKRHRDPADKNLKLAVDDWPKMYEDGWESIGENALPAANLASVIPFTQLNDSKDAVLFTLIILEQDGTIKMLKGDAIHAENTWVTLTGSVKEPGVTSPPKLTRMAYWNNTAFGIDDQNNSWDLTMSLESRTYTMSNRDALGKPVTELTANDKGPVVLHENGYLYQRIVEDPPSDGQDPVLSWNQWIRADGVAHLGAASPGVVFDLDRLTRVLKERYIDTQRDMLADCKSSKLSPRPMSFCATCCWSTLTSTTMRRRTSSGMWRFRLAASSSPQPCRGQRG
jgi:hypothetical protein